MFLVPDIRLKYWVETLTPNAVRSPNEPSSNTAVIIIVEKLGKHPPLPLKARPIYSGNYINAYLIMPKLLHLKISVD